MQKRPNILIMLSDQQRPDTMGCYGQKLPVTPNIDRWAAEGTRFANAFTPQPVCGPARSCLQTGVYATETGCYRNDIALPFDRRTIAHQLSDAGYRVGYVGKWHLASTGAEEDYKIRPIPPERRGGWRDFWVASDVLEFTSHGYGGHFFDSNGERVGFDGYRVDATTDQAIRFLHERPEGDQRPWCLFVSWLEPHHQNDRGHYEGPEGSKERFSDFEPPGDLEQFEGDWMEEYPDYLGCCASIDENVARIFGTLRESGEWEETLKIYISDHGSHFRTRNGEYKRSCHDASVRVPMILQGPGVPEGTIREELTSLLDIPATVLDAAGLPTTHMRGIPLQRLLAGQESWREEVFVQISESQIGRALRTARYKYGVSVPIERVDDPRPGSPAYLEECLYDLEKDPFELHNLLGDERYDDLRARLRMRLLAHIEEVEGVSPQIFPAKEYAEPLA